MSQRLIPAPLTLEFSKADESDERFEREYQFLSGIEDDAIGHWLKLAKAKGDTQDTDSVLLQLLVELHRKVDSLEQLIKDEAPKRITLDVQAQISGINFEGFELKEPLFEKDMLYYGRITLPVYPKRDVGIFFQATSQTSATTVRIHDRDINEWNAYVTARERVMIRDMKGRS